MTHHPLIRFEAPQVPDSDVTVRCAQGHEAFALIVRVRLAGALVTRHARCTVCGEEQPVD